MSHSRPLADTADNWKQFAARSIGVIGWLLLTFGILFGGLQTSLHIQMYEAQARGVTLDRVYSVFFWWCFWGAVSIGYIVSSLLAKHDWRTGACAAGVFAFGHLLVTMVVLIEIGWV